MTEFHPYEPFVPEKANKLIIGTIPPQRFCQENTNLYANDVDFYYGSRDSYFWSLIGKTFQKEFSYSNSENAINERKNFLLEMNMGITDIVKTCMRNSNSSSDKHLGIKEYNDLASLLKEHKSIDTLIYTSKFVKSCVNDFVKTYHSHHDGYQTVKVNDKTYKVWILYSPSPQALRNMGPDGQQKREEQYRKILIN